MSWTPRSDAATRLTVGAFREECESLRDVLDAALTALQSTSPSRPSPP
jgi:hypothetical protein